MPSSRLPLFHIDPIWAFAEMKTQGLVDTILPIKNDDGWTETITNISYQEEVKSFPIGFEKNKYQFQNSIQIVKDFLLKNKKQIKNIKVQAFSSVEGTLERNIFLQKKRAELIVEEIKNVGFSNQIIETKSNENWDLFYQQIANTEWSDWANIPKSKVKVFLKNKSTEKKLESLLSQQRIANVIITFDDEVIEESYTTSYFDDVKTVSNVKELLGKFSKLVAKNKIDSALLVQYELIQNFLERKINIQDIVNLSLIHI